jgi:hypothetical protein
VGSIETTGQVSQPDTVLFEKLLRSGQFTSPTRITLSYVRFRGFVANDELGVRVLVLHYDGQGGEIAAHEVRHPGKKIEGPGLVLEVVGDDLEYTVTEHDNVSGTRINAVVEGRFAGLAAPPPKPDFTDVPPDHRFYPHIMAGVRRGVISGYDDGTFRPDNNLTRGQLMKILAESMGWT